MGRLEERLFEASVDKPLVCMRFIDDVFFIWTHAEEKLKHFINFLNKTVSVNNNNNINFSPMRVVLLGRKRSNGSTTVVQYAFSYFQDRYLLA